MIRCCRDYRNGARSISILFTSDCAVSAAFNYFVCFKLRFMSMPANSFAGVNANEVITEGAFGLGRGNKVLESNTFESGMG